MQSAPLLEATSPVPSTSLPSTERYQVVRRLGQGGMGAVYEAYDRRRERKVAMKVLRDPERSSLYRFKREFRAAADLLHPNLVRLFDLGVLDDGNFFFTMELIEGHSLNHYTALPPGGTESLALADTLFPASNGASSPSGSLYLNTEEIVKVLSGILEGLSFLHRSRKVHRDLKPANIMLDKEGQVKLLDFGILREMDNPSPLTTGKGVAIGTPLFMAPEQAAGQEVGFAADLYALGCVLYYLLTGVPPFQGPSHRVMMQHILEPPRPPSSLRPCAPLLEEICLSLLQKSPSARPTAPALLERLYREAKGPKPLPPQRVPSSAPGFLGRSSELAFLQRAWDEAREQPVVVLIAGESGAGKSALCQELAQTVQAEGAGAWFGRCYEREEVPYKAFDAIIDAVSLTLQKQGEGAFRLLPPGTPSLARLFPVLREVPPVRSLGADTTLRDVQAERHRAARALFALLTNLSGRSPLLVLDDLQWADAGSIDVLLWLLQSPEAPPCLVLGTYRHQEVPESHPLQSLFQHPKRLKTLQLPPLDQDSLGELVEAYSAITLPSEARERLAREAGGNPFLAVELARALDKETSAAELPTISELVKKRLLRVSEDAREVLEAAAVVGGRATFGLLHTATGFSQSRLAEAIDELLRAELLREVPGPRGEEAYDLSHDRFREAVYQGIPPVRRKALHRALAEHLASEEDAARAVEHWRQAEEPLLARKAALSAARKAEEQLAFRRAADLYALASGEEENYALTFCRAESLRKAGCHKEAAQAFEAAARYTQKLSESREAELHAATEYLGAGEIQRGLDQLESLLKQFGESFACSRFTRLLRILFGTIALALCWLWHDLLALSESRQRDEEPHEDDLFRLKLYQESYHHLINLDPMMGGEFGIKHARLAYRLRAPEHLGRARLSYAVELLGLFGRHASTRAFHHLQLGEALCARDTRGLLMGQFARSFMQLYDGNREATRQAATRGAELARRGGHFGDPILGMIHVLHMGGEFFSGDLQAAQQLCASYLADARARGNILDCAEPLLFLGKIHLMQGRGEEGRAALEEALRLYPAEPITLPRLRLELSAVDIFLYDGDISGGLARLDDIRRRWRARGLVASNFEKSLFLLQRARLRLLQARVTGRVKEPGALYPSLGFTASTAPLTLQTGALRAEAALALLHKRHKHALRALNRALLIAERRTNRVEMGLTLAARATVRARLGLPGADFDRERAQNELSAVGASNCFLLRVEGWEEIGEREAKSVDLPSPAR